MGPHRIPSSCPKPCSGVAQLQLSSRTASKRIGRGGFVVVGMPLLLPPAELSLSLNKTCRPPRSGPQINGRYGHYKTKSAAHLSCAGAIRAKYFMEWLAAGRAGRTCPTFRRALELGSRRVGLGARGQEQWPSRVHRSDGLCRQSFIAGNDLCVGL